MTPAISPTALPQTEIAEVSSWRTRANLILQTIARYLLAFGIMPYGVSKLANLQFQVTAWDYSRPLGAASGSTLTWALLGYSPWFQFLLGFLEAFPGVLLCFRRTRRLGALLLFPVLLNVVLMNFAMDLWDATKEISLFLLALNVYLLASDLPMYVSFLKRFVHGAAPIRNVRWRVAIAVVEVLIPIALLGYWAHNLDTMSATIMRSSRDFIGDRHINSAGTWSIQKMTFSGKEGYQSGRFLLFDFGGRCYYQFNGQTAAGSFEADRVNHTFEISEIDLDGDRSPIRGTYVVEGNRLSLRGERRGQPVEIVLQKSHWGRQLPY